MNKAFLPLLLLLFVAAGCSRVSDQGNQNQTPVQNQEQQQEEVVDVRTDTKVEAPLAEDTGRSPVPSGEADADVAPMPEVFEVKLTSNGYSPAEITIHKGDYVQFTNVDSKKIWPASDPHPIHTNLSGFDAKRGLAEGEKYRFQFNIVGTWGYHDHLNPSVKGKVIVK